METKRQQNVTRREESQGVEAKNIISMAGAWWEINQVGQKKVEMNIQEASKRNHIKNRTHKPNISEIPKKGRGGWRCEH